MISEIISEIINSFNPIVFSSRTNPVVPHTGVTKYMEVTPPGLPQLTCSTNHIASVRMDTNMQMSIVSLNSFFSFSCRVCDALTTLIKKS